MTKDITVLASTTQEELDTKGADVEYRFCANLKEAKQRAKYYFTEEYRVRSESSTRLGYACVMVDGKCVEDYFLNISGVTI